VGPDCLHCLSDYLRFFFLLYAALNVAACLSDSFSKLASISHFSSSLRSTFFGTGEKHFLCPLDPDWHKSLMLPPLHNEDFLLCCRSGTESGSVRIQNFWPDSDPIRNQNKHFGSGFESRFKSGFKSGSETGSEINQKKEPYIYAKIRWFHMIIQISHLHVVVCAMYMLEQTVWLGTG
jgi:hypothetical protein